MAVIGDVLVKLVADFAEFGKGMDDANKKLDDFGKAAGDINSTLQGFGAAASKFVAGLGIAAAAQQALNYADNIQKAAANTADLAQQVKLSTSQVQALQALSERTGESFAELAKKGAQ